MSVRSVELREITDEDREAVTSLRVRPDQELFVAPVARSLEDAAAAPEENPWLRAVYRDGQPVGFVMLSWHPPASGRWFLWRLLVDARHQGEGIGRAVLAQVADLVRADGGTELLTSYEPGEGGPGPFYEGFGSRPTGDVDDGEIFRRLPLDGAG